MADADGVISSRMNTDDTDFFKKYTEKADIDGLISSRMNTENTDKKSGHGKGGRREKADFLN
jgi:hypothetical protein